MTLTEGNSLFSKTNAEANFCWPRQQSSTNTRRWLNVSYSARESRFKGHGNTTSLSRQINAILPALRMPPLVNDSWPVTPWSLCNIWKNSYAHVVTFLARIDIKQMSLLMEPSESLFCIYFVVYNIVYCWTWKVMFWQGHVSCEVFLSDIITVFLLVL